MGAGLFVLLSPQCHEGLRFAVAARRTRKIVRMGQLSTEYNFTAVQQSRCRESWFLTLDIWHQRHKPRPLYPCCKVPLPFGSQTSSASTVHTSMWVYVSVQTIDVFVVNVIGWCALFYFCFHGVFYLLINVFISDFLVWIFCSLAWRLMSNKALAKNYLNGTSVQWK